MLSSFWIRFSPLRPYNPPFRDFGIRVSGVSAVIPKFLVIVYPNAIANLSVTVHDAGREERMKNIPNRSKAAPAFQRCQDVGLQW